MSGNILTACVLLILIFSTVWWHEAQTYENKYSEIQKYYISRWLVEDIALLNAFSEDALGFINSSNYTGAFVSIRHAKMAMISFREPLYQIVLYLGETHNESILKMTQTDSCAKFLDLSAEKIWSGNNNSIQIIKDGLVEIQNFSEQLLRQHPITELASEVTFEKNEELQNKCEVWLKKLEG